MLRALLPAAPRRLLSSASARPPRFVPAQKAQQVPSQARARLIPPKKKVKNRATPANVVLRTEEQHVMGRLSAHVMANSHDPLALSTELRGRFGAGAVQVFGGSTAVDGSLVPGDVGLIEGVVHLSAPASGKEAAHGSPNMSAFFFTGSKDADGLSTSACVSVWWGAEPSFEDALLRDLRASFDKAQGRFSAGRSTALSRQQQLDRLAIPRTVMRWQPGPRSELARDEVSHVEIVIDAECDARSRVLDQLAFSHALQRHMKLLLLEDEMERILSSVKRIVRQGLGGNFRRFLPARLGGVDSGARTMQRLLLMREFNFDDSIMSTPDWLWEQPAREAMYDAMVAEYEIVDRIESINQQLDYAQATMQSLKEDAQHHHSTFLEYTIVILLGFEVLVEMHAMGWIDLAAQRQEEEASHD